MWDYVYVKEPCCALPAKLDGSIALATAGSDGEAIQPAAQPPGGDSELLQDENPHGGGGSSERKYQSPASKRAWLPGSYLFAPEGAALGSH